MHHSILQLFRWGTVFLCLLTVGIIGGQVNSQVAPKILYDFRTLSDLDNWYEASDHTYREPGMSKASFVLQKTQLFQKAVLFSVLNPQPNGAGFAGYRNDDSWNLEEYSALELVTRAQGQNGIYKIDLRHKSMNTSEGSYEAFFHLPIGEESRVTIPFNDFKFYHRGNLVPDAEPLDNTDITNFGIQIPGGVYEDWKQNGTSSLEIDYIQAVVG